MITKPLQVSEGPTLVEQLRVLRGGTMAVSDSEAALFAGLQARDLHAFERLYDDYGRRALGLAYRLTGDYAQAQDVLQEAFVAIWQNADRLDPERGRLQPLLFAVVHHKASDHLRRRQREAGVAAAMPAREPRTGPLDDPETQALQSAERGVIERALAVLPTEQRVAVQLAYYGGHSHSEIARLTQAPLGTVKSRLRSALQRLRLIMVPGTEL